jgi:hypothetical protein
MLKHCGSLTVVVIILGISGCKPASSHTRRSSNSIPTSVTPATGKQTYLAEGSSSPPIAGFNICTAPQYGATIYAPPGFEWESPANFYGAMNNADPSIGGGQKAFANNPIELFDATVSNLKPDLYPARIVVQDMPHMSIEQAETSYVSGGDNSWISKGDLSSPVGRIPVYERTISEDGLKGAKVSVIQRRYLMCWKSHSFAVFTYCPVNLMRIGYNLEQSVLTLRVKKFETSEAQIFPPSSQKNERFGTEGEFRQEESQQMRDQQMKDQVSQIERENEERRRLNEGSNQSSEQTPQ